MFIKRKAYAKINCNLKIIKREKNGYHKLESIMSLIDLYDEIIFEKSNEIEVHMVPQICEQEDNLCYKVACYMKRYSKYDKGIKITINKKIPAGGGLGGGSSNAATVIKFLNNYWSLHLNRKTLMKIAFKFGSDIPFFIGANQSIVFGFGEKMKKAKRTISKEILLIIPPFSLSTKSVFENLNIDDLKSKRNKTCDMVNDLETSANDISKNKIYKIKEKIEKIGKGYCLMSGSGSTVVYYIDEKSESSIDMYNQIKNILPDCNIILSKTKIKQ